MIYRVKTKYLVSIILPLSLLFNQCSQRQSKSVRSDEFLEKVSIGLGNDGEVGRSWSEGSGLDDFLVLVEVNTKKTRELSGVYASKFSLDRIPDSQKNRAETVLTLFERTGFLNKDRRKEAQVWVRDSPDGVIYMIVLSEEDLLLLGRSEQ